MSVKVVPRCGATWWHAEEQKGQRTVVHHECSRPAGHTGWHTCLQHATPDRMYPGSARVRERSTSG